MKTMPAILALLVGLVGFKAAAAGDITAKRLVCKYSSKLAERMVDSVYTFTHDSSDPFIADFSSTQDGENRVRYSLNGNQLVFEFQPGIEKVYDISNPKMIQRSFEDCAGGYVGSGVACRTEVETCALVF